MTNTRRTSHRPSHVHHRPAHWDKHEIKEAFAFWLGFEALLNLLNLCSFELFRWLRDAMEDELIPGLAMALVVFVAYTPVSRYGLLLAAMKTYGYHLGQTILKLRVEQILRHLVGHHMRAILLWAAGTACIHLTVGLAKAVLHRPADPPSLRAPVNVPPRRTTPRTPSDPPNRAKLVPINAR